MEQVSIDIVSAAFSSSLGIADTWIQNWPNLPKQSALTQQDGFWAFPLSSLSNKVLADFVGQHDFLRKTDRVVQLAALTGVKAYEASGWNNSAQVHIHVGSSRGATHIWEHAHRQFIETQATPARTSPYTTLGNLSTSLARVLHLQGAHLEHSITCSSGLQSILNGIAWIKSGWAQCFVAGAAETPLTPFTYAAMNAVGLYGNKYIAMPGYKALTENSLVLGEGAGMICLSPSVAGANRLAQIIGVGWAQEMEPSVTGISERGDAFATAMQAALAGVDEADYPEVVVLHAPGTKKGDKAEWSAVQRVFTAQTPVCISTKHHTGHTFGASGMLSLQWAIHILHKQSLPVLPYPVYWPQQSITKSVRSVLINAMGFGGNAISILLKL